MRNKIPTYTVLGFIDSGKTTFINSFLNDSQKIYGVIQFENGDINVHKQDNVKILNIPFREITKNISYTSEKIFSFIKENNFNEIWIESNGIMPLNTLNKIFFNKFNSYNNIAEKLDFRKTIFITDSRLKSFIKSTDNEIITDFILNSNLAYVINNDENTKKLLLNINNKIKIKNIETIKSSIYKPFSINHIKPIAIILSVLVLYCILYYIPKNNIIIPINTIITLLSGIILQSFPFLLLGIIISSCIQIFMPTNFLDKYFPKDPILGIIFAAAIGICFPVCDCATIPVFRGLIKKGLPISSAVSFMIATPIINPIVILSTYNAYNGDLRIVFLRCGLGFLAALIIGLIFHILKTKNILKEGEILSLNCKTYFKNNDSNIIKLLKHTQGEFLDVAKYLILGALISSIIQVYLSKINWSATTYSTLSSILIMMSMGFLLSLCSSSDVIIAKGFGNNFPFISILSFLIYGPMIDLKNIILLSESFKKKFIFQLTAIITIVCMAIILFLNFL